MSLFVSVIIPTRDRAEALCECLEALAGQTMGVSAFEVVVVDDGSEVPVEVGDGGRYGGMEVRVIRQENAGPGAARNRGVAEARGRLVAFTDDDCRPRPEWLAELTGAIEAGGGGVLAGGVTENGLPGIPGSTVSQLIIDLVYEHFNADAEAARFFASNNMACEREAYLAVGGFDARFRLASEDRDLCDRWLGSGRRLVQVEGARVVHGHAQTLMAFTRLHFRYGRGASMYRRMRAGRGGDGMGADLGFHRQLPGRVWRRLRGEPWGRVLVVAGLLVWWEVVNAAGFFWEEWRSRGVKVAG
jgi:glycosyltransferase involved in cell wall biosynthesis